MMFCARCGQQIAEGSVSCPFCGLPPNVSWQPVPQPAPNPVAPQVFYSPSAGPRGVQGWLLFFSISLTILWPMWILGHYALGFFDLRRSYGSIMLRPDSVVGLLRVVFGIVTGALVWAENRSAMMFLRIYYAFGAALMLWTLLAWVRILSRVHLGPYVVTWVINLAPSLIFLVAGILYFSLSQRVRNTLGSNLFG
jgi:hypothetical protein